MMRRKKIYKVFRATMCSVLLIALVLPATGQYVPTYVPKANWGACPADPNTLAGRFRPLPVFAHNDVGSPVTSWPAIGQYDFCAYMDTVFCQLKLIPELVPDLADDVTEYADYLRCIDGDINGPVLIEPEGWVPPAEIPVTISVNASGQCTVWWNGIRTHNNVAIPGWSPQANWYMGFGARTGGSHDFHIVDNFNLTSSAMNYSENFSAGPGLGTLYGSAQIKFQQLVLTEKVESQQGSWSFNPTSPLGTFSVSYMQYIGSGSGADGMSFAYSPGANASFGESGLPTGLSVSWHTWSGATNFGKICLKYNDTQLLCTDPGVPLRTRNDFVPISGNGMLDGQYEMRLLEYVLNTPAHPLHSTAHSVIQHNFKFMKDTLQAGLLEEGYLAIAGLFARWLVGSLAMTLSGYAALGDDLTYLALDELMGLLEDIMPMPPGGIRSITRSVPSLGPYGDANGDGFKNIDLHDYYVSVLNYNAGQYIARAMSPVTFSLQGERYYDVDDTIQLQLLVAGITPATLVWKKDGTPLAEPSNLLTIDNAQEEDTGNYSVTVTHPMYSGGPIATLVASMNVYVGEFAMPTLALAGLAALGGLIGLFGARRMRRRK